MDFKGKGIEVSVVAAEQSDGHLVAAAQEILEAAKDRGLILPFSGATAIEGATEARPETVDAKEAITGQLNTSFTGYLTTVIEISKSREEDIVAASQETLNTEFSEWFDETRQAYVAEAMEAGTEFYLLAVPNETVAVDEIIADARSFGKNQPYPTEVYPEVISQYTAQEVSGTDPGNGKRFNFVLVPKDFTPELYGKVKNQKDELAEMQGDTPFLEAPTPLTAMAFMHTRRADGDKLVGTGTSDATYFRCYNMEPKAFGRDSCVPYLFVDVSGRLFVGRSSVRFGDDGRALVG